MRDLLSAPAICRGVSLTFVMTVGLLISATNRASAGTLVTIDTNFGDIQVDLFNDVAPNTVTNFVNLVAGGNYTNTIIHRSVSNFVIQGGGFSTTYSPISNLGQIPLEYKIDNIRGTISMARTDSPNSATSQWFISTKDNTSTLGPGGSSPDGYAAFGWVLEGMDVVDAIAALPKFNYGQPFNELPLRNFTQEEYQEGKIPDTNNTVIINSVSIAEQHPSYQNPLWNVDVNNSGTLSTADALSVVNSLLIHGRRFAADGSKIDKTYKYFDTNGDNFVSTSDLLVVINAILRGDTAPANPLAAPLVSALAAPEATPLVVPEPSSVMLALSAVVASGAFAIRRRKAAKAT